MFRDIPAGLFGGAKPYADDSMYIVVLVQEPFLSGWMKRTPVLLAFSASDGISN